MTALSVIKLMPENKDSLRKFAEDVINQAVCGMVNAFEVDTNLTYIEKVVEYIRKNPDFKKEVIFCREKYGEKSVEYKGLLSQIVSKTNYDFSGCMKWVELKKKESAIAEERKKLEATMKSINTSLVDPETGEEICPATLKENTTYILYK